MKILIVLAAPDLLYDTIKQENEVRLVKIFVDNPEMEKVVTRTFSGETIVIAKNDHF